MAQIPRVTQPIFASGASNNGQFGSAQASTFVLTNNLATLMSLPAWAIGWSDAVIGSSKFPPLEEFQAIDYIITTQLAYLFQAGIPEYDAGTPYYQYSVVRNPGTFQLYGSVYGGENIGQSLSNGTYWQELISLSGSGFLVAANNLSDVANAAAAASNLGLGTGNSPTFSEVVTASGFVMNNTGSLRSSDSGGVQRTCIEVDAGNNMNVGDAGLTGNLVTQRPINFGSYQSQTLSNLGALAASAALGGSAQTWSVVTGSRGLGTVYTNSTGRPIFVCATFSSSTGSDGVQAKINGGAFAEAGCSTSSYSYANVWFIVPAGATYELVTLTGSPNLIYWSELR